jgi:hypothetical protein
VLSVNIARKEREMLGEISPLGRPVAVRVAPVVEVCPVRDPEDPDPPDAAVAVRVEVPLSATGRLGLGPLPFSSEVWS